jgi:DNA-binding GntR family transcriptional regulator
VKGNSVYKRAFNDCLDLVGRLAVGDAFPSEIELARRLAVSRTTVRAVLSGLATAGIASEASGRRRLARRPTETDFFPPPQTESVGDAVERQFLDWMLLGDLRPDQTINCAELARRFSTSITAVREYLGRVQSFGLVERRPNSAWVFKGITLDFAEEICEVRETFEQRSAQRFAELDPDHPAWTELDRIEADHRALLAEMDTRWREFSRLDDRLHRLVHDASRNRFIQNFYDVIAMIFHYHYQWNKLDEKERNTAAIAEHLDYIAALKSRDRARIAAVCRAHLATARQTLTRSIDVAGRAAD